MNRSPTASDRSPSPADDYAAAAAVDRVCLAFEDEWCQGARPDLAAALTQLDGPVREALFAELLAIELVYRRRLGENPSSAEYLEKYPEYRESIEHAFPAAGAPAITFVPGEVIGRYVLERELGRGSFGTVYLANDLLLNRQVAIKVPGHGAATRAAEIARLVEEMRTAARLQHPGIVRIYDVQPLADNRLYAVLQYVAGRSLRAELDARRRSPDDMARSLAEVADALAYAHRQGFVHRDLSPSNILLDEEGTPHITDFGLAVHQDDQPWRAGELAGSWAYMAPEQVRGDMHRLDGRADLWALGVILYEACTGRRPFRGETPEQLRAAILDDVPRPPRQLASDMSPALERICLRCLAKTPEDRFATAADLAQALRAATRTRSRAPAAWLSVLLLLVVCGALGLLGAYRRAGSVPVQRSSISQPKLTLWVWRDGIWGDATRTELLPLVAGDQVRITIEVPEPSYLYAVWLSASGELTGLYPWQAGDWTKRGGESPRERLQLPSERIEETWTMEPGPSGSEALLVFGRSTPLPEDVRMEHLLAELGPLPPWPTPRSVRFDYETIEVLAQMRSVDPGRSRTIDDPVLRLQATLRQRMKPHFAWCAAMAFSVAPAESGPLTSAEHREE